MAAAERFGAPAATSPRSNQLPDKYKGKTGPQMVYAPPISAAQIRAVVQPKTITRGGLHSPMPPRTLASNTSKIPKRVGVADLKQPTLATTVGNSQPGCSMSSGCSSTQETDSNMSHASTPPCNQIRRGACRSLSYYAFWQAPAPHRLRSITINNNQMMQHMLSFDGCRDLIRGSPLSTILRRGARVFSSSTGSASTYALSQPVDHVGAFVSHNWSTPGYLKFLALSLHFNFNVAALLSLILLAGLGTASLLGALPTYENKFHPYPVGFVCQAVCVPFFICTVFCMRDIQHCFKDSSISTFLDVCCIDQTDADTKRRGIEKLGAFLKISKTVVVLFTEVYLKKLWTVYELASFLALHPSENLVVLPVFGAKVFFFATVVMWLSFIVNIPFVAIVRFWQLKSIFAAICIFVVVVLLREWARQKKAMRSRFRAFTVWNCDCANENDRPIVEKNIALLMQAMLGFPQDFSDDYALHEFHKLIHKSLPEALFPVLGRLTFRYRHTALVALLVYGADAADELNALPKEALGNLAIILDKVWRGCFQIPITIALIELLASLHLGFTGVKDVCWTIFITLLVTGVLIAYDQLLYWLHTPPVLALDIAVFVVFNVTGVIVALFVFGSGKCSLHACIERYRPVHWESDLPEETE